MWLYLAVPIALALLATLATFAATLRGVAQLGEPRGRASGADADLARPLLDDRDGLAEAALGCVSVVLGLAMLPEAPDWPLPPSVYVDLARAVIVPLAALGAEAAVGALRRALARGAPVLAYPSDLAEPRATALLVGFVSAGSVAFLPAWLAGTAAWTPGLSGLAFAVALLYLGWRHRLGRFHALAALSALLGVAISLQPADLLLRTAAYFVAIGICLLVSGGTTFRGFARRELGAASPGQP